MRPAWRAARAAGCTRRVLRRRPAAVLCARPACQLELPMGAGGSPAHAFGAPAGVRGRHLAPHLPIVRNPSPASPWIGSSFSSSLRSSGRRKASRISSALLPSISRAMAREAAGAGRGREGPRLSGWPSAPGRALACGAQQFTQSSTQALALAPQSTQQPKPPTAPHSPKPPNPTPFLQCTRTQVHQHASPPHQTPTPPPPPSQCQARTQVHQHAHLSWKPWLWSAPTQAARQPPLLSSVPGTHPGPPACASFMQTLAVESTYPGSQAPPPAPSAPTHPGPPARQSTHQPGSQARPPRSLSPHPPRSTSTRISRPSAAEVRSQSCEESRRMKRSSNMRRSCKAGGAAPGAGQRVCKWRGVPCALGSPHTLRGTGSGEPSSSQQEAPSPRGAAPPQ